LAFDEKAFENLEAVGRLQPGEGGREGLHNAAASRAYYAAYHAVAHVAQRDGIEFTSERSYYRHDTLPDDARGWGILDEEQRLDLWELQNLRIKADYHEAPVELEEADRAEMLARGLVTRLLP
jgi:hypothetical protein